MTDIHRERATVRKADLQLDFEKRTPLIVLAFDTEETVEMTDGISPNRLSELMMAFGLHECTYLSALDNRPVEIEMDWDMERMIAFTPENGRRFCL
ncbi:hypothetical protein [Bifidobacterium sp. SO1]|uniref:hypothetical protein n=1 Tax=Bifidobacterium sp. SO1 TaxID=2809029 RepID=UPI001BDC9437|nr:hypothetical protein [Bifidobacterium sp. SO1]MBT1162813.1 hypothetical protein [Bifidobacterium sp. SO1]